jgi:hypothetical protein
MRLGLWRILLVSSVCIVIASAGESEVLRTDGFCLERLVVLAGSVRTSALSSLEAGPCSKAKSLMIDAFADGNEAHSQFVPLDLTYEGWRTAVGLGFPKLEPRARVVSLRGGVVLFDRDARGEVSKKVIRGLDVTLSHVGSSTCQLVNITVSNPGELDSGVRLYFQTPQPTLKVTKTLVSEWRDALKFNRLYVALSDSPLFDLGDSLVPIIPPFATSVSAVLALENRATTFSCDSTDGGKMKCR